jgi:hypothetical protein
MRSSKTEQEWTKFEELLQALPPESFECIAPRSGSADRRDREVYKLFVRTKGSRDLRWWLFEQQLLRVPANYPTINYPQLEKNPADFVTGSLVQLRGIEAENPEEKPALARALQAVRARMEASPHLGNSPLNRTM